MAQLRYLGTEPAYVTPLNRTVQPDESVEVDDALVWRAQVRDDDGKVTDEGNETGFVWPESLWAPVDTRRTRGAAPGSDDKDKE